MKLSLSFLPFLMAATAMAKPDAKAKQNEKNDQPQQKQPQKPALRTLQMDDAAILGGTIVGSATKYPYFGQWDFCGGTLVHDDILLTAAWCLGVDPTIANLPTDEVRFLSTKLGPPIGTATEGFTRKIIGFARHPDWNQNEASNDPAVAVPYTGKNDFALLKLDSSALTGGATLVDLSRYSNEPDPGQTVTILGFGGVSGAPGFASVDLREGKVTIGTAAQCRAAIPFYTEELTCYIGTAGSQGGCEGDYGAPMIDDSTGFQVGVFGDSGRDANNNCIGNFGWYARNPVQKYVNWIDENVCKLTSMPRDRCQSFGNTPKPTPAPTTEAQGIIKTYRYNVNTVFGFNDSKNPIVPSASDASEFLRVTELFYSRILAEAYSLSYQSDSIPATPVNFVVTNVLQKTAVFDATLSIAYQTTVQVRKYPGIPTAAQVEMVLEFFDKKDYLQSFINRISPTWSLATSVATAVVDIPPPGTIPGQVP